MFGVCDLSACRARKSNKKKMSEAAASGALTRSKSLAKRLKSKCALPCIVRLPTALYRMQRCT